jgi:transcriptional regulator of arginine metabolism
MHFFCIIMHMRIERLKTIKDIIKNTQIGSQENLAEELDTRGFHVTQATLSRDLKFLKVGKIPDTAGGFNYSLPKAESAKETAAGFYQDLERGCIAIGFSHNLGVLHTMPGHANSAAFALDNLEFDEILGTIAGDDTVLIILKEQTDKKTFSVKLQQKIPHLEVIG